MEVSVHHRLAPLFGSVMIQIMTDACGRTQRLTKWPGAKRGKEEGSRVSQSPSRAHLQPSPCGSQLLEVWSLPNSAKLRSKPHGSLGDTYFPNYSIRTCIHGPCCTLWLSICQSITHCARHSLQMTTGWVRCASFQGVLTVRETQTSKNWQLRYNVVEVWWRGGPDCYVSTEEEGCMAQTRGSGDQGWLSEGSDI